MRNILSIIACSVILLITGCDKNELPVPLDYNVQAQLKINYSSAYSSNPAVQLKINGQRVSSLLQYSYPFPGGGLNTQGGSQPDYVAVPKGNLSLSVSIPKVGTDTDSLELFSTNVNITEDAYYTLHIADTLSNTQSVLLKENTASPDSGYSKYRFVNLMPNQAAVDLYFGSTLVAQNIPYKGASEYFTLQQATAGQWAIRPTGAAASSTALAIYPTGSTLNTVPNQRVFTVYARGYSGSTDANRKPNVSLFYVR